MFKETYSKLDTTQKNTTLLVMSICKDIKREQIMYCIYCRKQAQDKHHVIKKSQGGSNNKANLVNLCRSCHDIVHFSKNTELQNKILKKCYDTIRNDLDKCWIGKIKPKIVRQIKAGLK